MADDGEIGADTETTGLSWINSEVVGHCFSARVDGEYHGFYVPVRHETFDNYEGDENELENKLHTWLYNNPTLKKIFFNIKFDRNMLLNHNVEIDNAEDAMIMMFLRNENEKNHRLKDLSALYIDRDAADLADEVGTYFRSNKLEHYGQIPTELLGLYGAKDACLTLALWKMFGHDMLDDEESKKTDGLRKSIYKHEMAFTFLTARMERNGFPFNSDMCKSLIEPTTEALRKLEEHIWDLVFEKNENVQPINLNSDVELARMLDAVGFKPISYSQRTGKASWGRSQLLSLRNELAECIACYRNLAHNLNTFLEKLPTYVVDGRIFSSYNQIGARTGRASSSNPNLQQIPTRLPRYSMIPDYAQQALRQIFEIRKCFRAPEGYYFLKVDQSQFELRLLDHYAMDPTMHQAFLDGKDIHSDTASRLFDIPYDEVIIKKKDIHMKQLRDASKETNFAAVYGAGVKRLKETLDDYGHNFALDEVKRFYFRYFRIYSGIKHFTEQVMRTIKTRGYLFNQYGRHKRIPASKAYVGVNHLIQGVTADMLKDQMIRTENNVLDPSCKSHLILAVHDEVDYLIHESELELIPMIKEEAEDFPWCRTPILAEVQIGPSWAELEEWHE